MVILNIKRFFDRCTEASGQASAEDLAVGDLARADGQVFIMHQRRKGGIEMLELNPAGIEVAAIEVAGKIAIRSQELFAAPDGFFKRKIFEAMERIVMHEGAHRPVLGNDRARQANLASEFRTSGCNVGLGNNLARQAIHALELHASGCNVDRVVC